VVLAPPDRYVVGMIRAFNLTLAQLPSKPFRQVFWWSALLSLATAVILWTAVVWLIANTAFFGSLPYVGDWVDFAIQWAGGLAAFLLTIVLLPAFLGIFASLFLETICRAVERRYYPELAPARDVPIWESVWTGVRFAIIIVFFNILFLPAFIFLPGVAYWILNGILLGREYYELVAFRRMAPRDAAALRRRRRPALFIGGIVIAFVASIPVLNLLLPLFGTAFMLHIFQGLPGRPQQV
jgi:CysZ protein